MHPVTSPDSLSLCHTYTVSLWLLLSSTLLLDIQLDPRYKTFPVSQIPSLSLHASVSLSGVPFVAVCSQLRGSRVQVLVVR